VTTRVATARWRRIETLFHQAAEIETTQRGAFLDEACKDDPEMRAELDSLLSSSDGTLTDLKASVAMAAEQLLDARSQEGSRIGAYRLIRTLGEGGMGAVYLGSRDDDQYERLVAIKVIRAGLAKNAALQVRFRTERQILANLDHPNIARMLDGGITPDGSPYLVMEYIDGIALDVFCRERKLLLSERLRLFRMLCAAVDYAHRHLVIHRDIKPMNVLVTSEGSPKLLDFGIAKLVDPYQIGADPAVTSMSQRLLTPEYASPEQLLGQPVSTATDVYALGVLLFELLTGELPCVASSREAIKQAQAILENEPALPSAVCLRTQHLPVAEAERIQGDVDCIILKALKKEPEQRYASASQLLADIDRYLAGYPVEASEYGFSGRSAKFIGRHRVSAGLTAVVALLILSFGIGMGLLARRAASGEAKARREEEFLSSIFQAATPEGSKGEAVTARQLLDRAAGRIDRELSSDPQLQSEMAEDVGEAYVSLGLYDQAQPLLARALRLTGQAEGESSAEYADRLSSLATDYQLKSEYQKAEPLFRRAVTLNEAKHGRNSYAAAHALSNLGECLYWQDKDAEAEAVLRRALAIERPLGDGSQDGTRNYLALVLERKGAFPEAASLLHEAAEISARKEGRESQDYLISMHNLAGAQIDMGDLDGALKSDQEVLATRQRIWGPNHPDTGYSLNNIAWIYLEQGRWQDAEPLLRQDLEITRKLGTGPRYLTALGNWARLLQQKGDLAGAAAAYDQVQYLLAVGGRRESWMAAKILTYQSMLELERGNDNEAIQLAESSVKLQKQLGGDSHPQLASGLLTLGVANLLSNNPTAAEPLFRQAVAIRQRSYPSSHPELLIAQVRLGQALLGENRPKEALEVLKPALANAEAAPYPLPGWRMGELRLTYAMALRETGQESDAARLIAANSSAIDGYNQPAIRKYLAKEIQGSARASTPSKQHTQG
jgi:serine/threonine protein kinase/Tfp pilus assembly protein PilF